MPAETVSPDYVEDDQDYLDFLASISLRGGLRKCSKFVANF